MLFKIKRKIYKVLHPVMGEILMLHRVVSERSILEENKKLEVTSEYLEKTILKYKNAGYKFVSLDEVQNLIDCKQLGKAKFICFTFDDGYKDNYEIAYPILKKHNCPFTIFITTDFPDKKALLWWYRLEEILLRNTQLKLSDGTLYDCSDIHKKNIVFRQIREKIFNIQSNNMRETLNDMFENYLFEYDIKNIHTLTWEQIESISQDNLCTIASHTISHPRLTGLSISDIQHELIKSKERLEMHINKKVIHFAYPYGAYNNKLMHLVEKSGYMTACLANGGCVRKGEGRYKIKRNILLEA